jgi:vancomycin resistance protein YoaR
VTLEYTARAVSTGTDSRELQLAVAETPPQVRSEDLHDIDVSSVISTWETRYSNAAIDNDRTYNLKVGADKLNGHIIRPGQVFSFNGAVGDRTEKEGYRVAPVIQGGELIDGLAGGMCQIASTLHAAAFFAGLDIVRSTPHSRPSSYIPMGLDSTVVYPSVDLKLKNPYEFPIVIHYMVNQGAVKVELLGKKLPYHVAFEREIITEAKFPSTTRPDIEMPTGQKYPDQEGYPGYRIKRRRYLFTGKWKIDAKNENRGKPDGLVSRREWDLSYPPTTEIVRLGSGPASLKKREAPPSHHIPPIPASAKPLYVIQR